MTDEDINRRGEAFSETDAVGAFLAVAYHLINIRNTAKSNETYDYHRGFSRKTRNVTQFFNVSPFHLFQ